MPARGNLVMFFLSQSPLKPPLGSCCFPQLLSDEDCKSYCFVSRKMALEAVGFPQGLFGYSMRELWGYDFGGGTDEKTQILGTSCSSILQAFENVDANYSSPETATATAIEDAFVASTKPAAGRRKRRRSRSLKNQEEVENQRMTHIAVERNRRRQMNEYLAALRSLMPAPYVQKSDQASIVGGAINFVKELEKLVQSLEAHKRIKQRSSSKPFADLFTFPQYASNYSRSNDKNIESQSAMADVEVTMVDSHANLKLLAPRQPKQLLKMVVGLQSLHLTTLHLNVTTIDEMVLFSFSLKVEEQCRLTSVDEIAAAVHQLVVKIQEEAAFVCTAL